jgi:hypothetical protein
MDDVGGLHSAAGEGPMARLEESFGMDRRWDGVNIRFSVSA